MRETDLLHDVLDALPDATVIGRAVAGLDGRPVDMDLVWMNSVARDLLGDIGLTPQRASTSQPWNGGLLERCLAVLEMGEPDAGVGFVTDQRERSIGFTWQAIPVEPDLLLWIQRVDTEPFSDRDADRPTEDARLHAALSQSFDGHAFFHAGPDGWDITWSNDAYNRLDADGNLSADLEGMVAHVHETRRRISEVVPVNGLVFEVRLYPVESEVAVTVADQTELFATTAGLAWDVLHDPLTGIGNRSKLKRDLGALLSKGGAATVLCLDLDGFKEVNDTKGHAAGDEVLRQVAIRIKSALRDGEEAFRLGGDEFVAIAGPLGQVAATAVAERISAMIVEPIDTDHGQVCVSVSIGATIGTAAEPPAAIIARADKALYESKRNGDVVVFS